MKPRKTKAKKSDLDESQHHAIKEKPYITKEIETSITLLESPESGLVLEALLFLSKYADIQRNNLIFLHSRGLMPKLLALLDHNICIVRLSLRLLSQLLALEAAQLELNQQKFDERVLKIAGFYTGHKDPHVKEFAILILAAFAKLGRAHILLAEAGLISAVLKTVKTPESDTILNSSLELFSKFIEMEQVRGDLPTEKDFHLDLFIQHLNTSEACFRTILVIFEKITYFSDDHLLNRLKECQIVEHMFDIIMDPSHAEHTQTCLNIVWHCMGNEITRTYFVTTLEFLKFCQWVKNCPPEVGLICARIFLELAKIDSIKQLLFDLSIEDTILSFFKSDDKQVLNVTCDSVCFMSKHKYCCEKIVTPIVVKKLLTILGRQNDVYDPDNETALSTLYYLSRRDSRTVHMVRAFDGVEILMRYLRKKLPQDSYRKLLEIVNMFVTNNQLQKVILSPDLYEIILTQTLSKFVEICKRSLEIMINCLGVEEFRNYFLLNHGSRVIVDKLATSTDEETIRLLVIFVHNALIFEKLANDFVLRKILLVLKKIPEGVKYRNPLIQRVINLVFNMCLPVKFFETGRLELMDKLHERFYVITGPWSEPFPFLEVLEIRRMSTINTIYVVDDCGHHKTDTKEAHDCFSIQRQSITESALCSSSIISISSDQMKCAINYGRLSHDPFLPKYFSRVEKLTSGVSRLPEKIQILAKFVADCLCGPTEKGSISDKLHTFKLHIECIKEKLGTSMIPIGYLRLGFHCERALLFKALADHVYIPATLVKGKSKLYWNEVALIQSEKKAKVLRMFVVDLMDNVGQLLPVGSRECNVYCDIL
ncbi:hypothetical protein TcasGA2_TC000592 [Tribolium castaneum]|uniref:EDR1/CTR1/ARMC3-like peptidase-like domain-containing protein n=2 Tax=Tribolium castaneum TaxID=7070 RepID=D6W9F3_TRICA|nr:hypothetical protein TcasGA2_TC000592 [Tribolium castaneum]